MQLSVSPFRMENNTYRILAVGNESNVMRELKNQTMQTSKSARIQQVILPENICVNVGELATYAAVRPVVIKAKVIQRYTSRINIINADVCCAFVTS